MPIRTWSLIATTIFPSHSVGNRSGLRPPSADYYALQATLLRAWGYALRASTPQVDPDRLLTSVRGLFFYLYMIVDVWNRKTMAAQIFAEESMDHSTMLLAQSCLIHGMQPEELVLHSDNGGPMKGATMLATLHKPGVIPSFSRPSVSNDNPYSESLFRTMKYRLEYPSKPFENVEQAQSWVGGFVFRYNTQHRHSSIRFVTPDDRHFGREEHILANRRKVYEKARSRNPNRWSKNIRNWNPVHQVWLNPEEKNDAIQMHCLKKAALAMAQVTTPLTSADIIERIRSAERGNFGDCESIGHGVSEMRIHLGPGYRVYFTRVGDVVYVLLCGGTKHRQQHDIAKAQEMLRLLKEE